MLNETQCDDAFSPHPFLEPTDKSVYQPGDAVGVRWYAGVIPEAEEDRTFYTTKMTFDLFLLPYRSNNFTYDLLHNTTISFLNATADGVYWSYIPYAPCEATEIVYLWSIPKNFTAPPQVTNNEYVAVVQNAVDPDTGFLPGGSSALIESSPFQILSLPASSSSSTSDSNSDLDTTHVIPEP
ncbi:hypothetical protein NPX13_g3268 [Xylaria arbuscula]|uniref:Uncharacterized protein n=1 Tax=Xylaria arbuscula TaxID=114810 RepID=A0A9W8TQ97_9PEZI|nr:hypothetical protein NPX13_g3268 [Xylaria arbuscula]